MSDPSGLTHDSRFAIRDSRPSERYSRSILFPGLGPEGQAKIRRSSLAIVGVGAIGSVAAEIATRAGFGRVTLIDRDVVEESNLERQFLFDEDDARACRPKAEAAAARLKRLNSEVTVSGAVVDLTHRNALEILFGHDLLLDASDNFETRLLVAEAAAQAGVPSVYAACVGDEGLVAVTIPKQTPCLRCYLEVLPPAGAGPTCDTAGVLPTLPPLVASLSMNEVLRIAAGREPSRGVLAVRLWESDVKTTRAFEGARPSAECPVCSGKRYPALEGEGASEVVKLCGRRSVQVAPAGRERPDFDELGRRLGAVGQVQRSPNVLSVAVEDVLLTLFADGRCVIRGTDDLARARALYQRYVGR